MSCFSARLSSLQLTTGSLSDWSAQHKEDVELLEWAQRRPQRCSEGWSPSALETLGELGMSTWRREGSGEDL